MKKVFLVTCVLVLLPCPAWLWSQYATVHLQQDFSNETERRADSLAHTSLKPLAAHRFDLSHNPFYEKDTAKYYFMVGTKLWRDHLASVKTDDFELALDPLFDFSFTHDFSDTTDYTDTARLWTNTRGAMLQGRIGDIVSFQATILENQAYFPNYFRRVIDSLGFDNQDNFGVVPGFGRTKPFYETGFDYSMSSGWIFVKPWKWLDVQMGHGKHFIGHGHRSLLLSDAAYNYPFAKATAYLAQDRIQYTAMGVQWQSLNRLPRLEVPEALFAKKVGTIHYVDFVPFNNFSMGLFEGNVWQRWDSTGVQPLPWQAYMPVAGIATATHNETATWFSLTGINLRWRISPHVMTYGQLAYDKRNAAAGWQAGFQFFDLGLRRFDLRVEWNSTGDNFYSNNPGRENYTHMNQPIGYVVGAGANEVIVQGFYHARNFFIRGSVNYIGQKTSVEGRILDRDLDQTRTYPMRHVNQVIAETGWMFNPKTNLQLAFGINRRLDRAGTFRRETTGLYVAFRTAIYNRYMDF